MAVGAITDHAVDGAKEHGALRGGGALAQVLQHQWPMGEDIDKLPQVEHAHLLKVLSLLVCSGRAAKGEREGESSTLCLVQIISCFGNVYPFISF